MLNGTGENIFRTIGAKDRLVDRVVNEVQRLIFEGQLKPDDKLPPERDFADQIGVSRTVLREAVHVLVTKGLLETRQGVGTVVRGITGNRLIEPLSILLQMQGISLDHLHQVRSILEVEIVRLAATQAEEADIARLWGILADMETSVGDTQKFIDLDDDFHQTLARTSHNPLMVVLLDSIGDLMREVREEVHRNPDIYAMVIPDHRQIITCIVAHDPKGARQAMLTHLEHARRLQDAVMAEQTGELSADQAAYPA